MDDGTIWTIIDHWRPVAMISGVLATVRLGYRGIVRLSVAAWERDRLREQIKVLESRIRQLDEIVDGTDSGSASNGTSSAKPGSTRTRIRNPRRSSKRSIG